MCLKEQSLKNLKVKINNKKIEIKTATLSESGVFQFNNIRKDYDYDFILLFGITPTDIYFNVYRHNDIVSDKEGEYILKGCEPNTYLGKLTQMSKDNTGADNYAKKSIRPNRTNPKTGQNYSFWLRKLTSKEFKNVLSALGI